MYQPDQVVTATLQDRIITATCQHFHIGESELLKSSIDRQVTYRKRVCSFLLRENTNLSFQSISSRLNYRNKNSAWIGVDEIRVQQNIYKQVANDIKEITRIALL